MPRWLNKLLGRELPHHPLGERGENVAARYLRDLGYKIIVRNYRCTTGEIDIIARDGDVLVFVEVKTRVESEPTPEDQVNSAKRHQVTKAAKSYLARYGYPPPAARMDVVAIIWPDGRNPQIRHIKSAFEATF